MIAIDVNSVEQWNRVMEIMDELIPREVYHLHINSVNTVVTPPTLKETKDTSELSDGRNGMEYRRQLQKGFICCLSSIVSHPTYTDLQKPILLRRTVRYLECCEMYGVIVFCFYFSGTRCLEIPIVRTSRIYPNSTEILLRHVSSF